MAYESERPARGERMTTASPRGSFATNDRGEAKGQPIAAGREADGTQWVLLLRAGANTARDGRTFTVHDLQDVLLASRRYAGATDIVVDFEHQTDLAHANGQPAPAAGWIKELSVRNRALWGCIEWTARAAAMIAAREYRYVSPTLRLDPGTGGGVRGVIRAALTNHPALDLIALATAQTGSASMIVPQSVLDALELPGDADEATIVAAIDALREAARAPIDMANANDGVVAQLVADLAEARSENTSRRAEEKVDQAIREGAIAPYLRDWGIRSCLADEQSFDALLSSMGRPLAHLFTSNAAFDRGIPEPSPAATDEAATIASQLGIDRADLYRETD